MAPGAGGRLRVVRHPYQVRRLRTVFGSGCACRNSCDFRVPDPRALRFPPSAHWPAQTERNPRIRGKPFLAASNAVADYSESPTSETSRERIEGVSRSLPFSDLLALTSSHMFFSVMN
jgi:hypothetical protein